MYIKSLFVRKWEIFFLSTSRRFVKWMSTSTFFGRNMPNAYNFLLFYRRILNLTTWIGLCIPNIIFLLLLCIEFLTVFNQYNMPHEFFVTPIFRLFCPKLYHFQNLKQFFWPKKERKVHLKGAHKKFKPSSTSRGILEGRGTILVVVQILI